MKQHGMTAEERFWANVDRSESCWLWTGSLSRGYGQVMMHGRMVRAHRYAYELLVGSIPTGLTIDHLCHVKNCVNPAHLEPVTQSENMRRAHRDGLVGTRTKRLLIEDRLGRELAGYVHELREDGASWAFIAARIERHTRVTVTDQTLRNWFGDAVSAA